MLELTYLRNNHQEAIEKLKTRNFDGEQTISEILRLDEGRRKTQTALDQTQAEMNKLSKSIGQLFKEGKQEEANSAKAETKELKEKIQQLKEDLSHIDQNLRAALYEVPNIPNDLVPKGNSDEDNEIISEHGNVPNLEEKLPHWELAEKYDLIDFELGVKVTGAGFPIYTGKGARLQRALINFFLDKALEAGYREFIPPHVVNEASGLGTGQLPDKEGQMYHIQEDDLYLIPTAEVPLTNMFRDRLLKKEDLPIKITGYTPCFRREAGSYGKDVRGLNRLHQFDKVEIVEVRHPEESYQALDEMVNHVKSILDDLELPYRVARLCGGDLGFTSAITYDMEVYSAAQERWLEVSSISNFESFQANRMKMRFKNDAGKSTLAHTLNGSALALPRILAAILENNQTNDGITIPKVLRSYTGFDKID